MQLKNKWFKYTLLVLFLLFLGLYFSSNAGLIDYQAKYKKSLTEKQIKQFEEDVKNNVNVDIKDYIDTDREEYSNGISNATMKISKTIGEIAQSILNFTFDKVEKTMRNN